MKDAEIRFTPIKLVQEDLEKDMITTIERLNFANRYVVTSRKYISNSECNHKNWEGFNRYFFTESAISHYVKDGKMKMIEYVNEFGELVKPINAFGF